MANINYREFIGICGAIGSGKSYVSKLISEKRDYMYVNLDEVFKTKVLTNPEHIEKVTKFMDIFGIVAFKDGVYNSKEITELLFSNLQNVYNYPILRAFNTINRNPIRDAMVEILSCKSSDAIIEGAVLKNLDFDFDAVIRVHSNMEGLVDKRDNRDPKLTRNIVQYQSSQLGTYYHKTFVLNNINIPGAGYESDDNILNQFDDIVKIARACRFAGIKCFE